MAISLNLQTQREAGALVLNLAPPDDSCTATIAGRTRVTGHVVIGIFIESTIAGRTIACRGHLPLAYDPNLLSDTTLHSGSQWQHGALLALSQNSPWQPAAYLEATARIAWNPAELIAAGPLIPWRPAIALSGYGIPSWSEGATLDGSSWNSWKNAERIINGTATVWNEADSLSAGTESGFKPRLPLLSPDVVLSFADGISLPQTLKSSMGDGLHVDSQWQTKWNEAGLAYNAWQSPYIPPLPPRPPNPPLKLNLWNFRPAGPLILNLGYTRPAWDVTDRRYYAVLNTCSVVRLPDRTELPVTAVSVETDCDSWAWSVSLSLAGPDAWALCQPTPYPVEVEISINGHLWTALLDDPQLTRGFNSIRIAAKGLSRSAWLITPYTPSETVEQLAPRTAQQIAESIVNNSGWTIDWQLPPDPQWLLPAGSYLRTGTPIERLVGLVAAVKGCLYSDPAGFVFTAYPRYPSLPWNWHIAPVDVALPESALLSWNQTSQDRPSVNRVYVSGTTAGVLLQLTKAGTDGALCANDPIVDSLLTDSYSARARAECELARAGPGYEVSVETILGGTANIPLVRPGLLCEFAGIRGVVRSCSIGASRQGGGLAVRQGLKLERRSGPWL
jgi:hypothetical protein